MQSQERIVHPIPPLYNEDSRVLILGSFPSVKSREAQFFYGHPQNRFWKVVSGILGEELPTTVPEKKAMLFAHKIALWDVIQSCDITGSSDSSIRNVVPNDLREILDHSQVERIFVNGKIAEKYYIRYTEPVLGRKAICLLSTSPANAAWSIDRLMEEWGQIIDTIA
ncbi:MAG: DNA-deoxyinosine glycosylase [Lachnospiraceae bacterium]|nr:DNA-deoxyinosine glycosylase [Lachnospiraceae bacterium]